jgi:hypothetical protein
MTSILEVEQLDTLSSNASSTITIGGTNTSNVTFKSGVNFSGITQGITEADQWRLTADIATNTNPITSNLERIDNTGFGYIGTGMSVSSGIWSFPTTGIYLIIVTLDASGETGDNIALNINTTTDNSTYTSVAECVTSGGTGPTINQSTQIVFFDVTNTSTHKVKFDVTSLGTNASVRGSTVESKTVFTFIRIGDT